MKITNIILARLKPHEKTGRKRLGELKNRLLAKKILINPIIADKDNFIILDGHHRVKALLELGYKKIPAVLVDYNSKKIIVASRRKKIKISKKIILEHVSRKKLFPCKTTKHTIPHRPMNINTPLFCLK